MRMETELSEFSRENKALELAMPHRGWCGVVFPLKPNDRKAAYVHLDIPVVGKGGLLIMHACINV